MSTSIKYIDFAPARQKQGFWGTFDYDTLDTVLERANEWKRRNYSYEIITMETVVLPNIFKRDEARTNYVAQFITGGSTVNNFQIIRIWYKG